MTIKFSDEVKSILKLTGMSDAQIQTAEVRANQASKRLEIVDAKGVAEEQWDTEKFSGDPGFIFSNPRS